MYEAPSGPTFAGPKTFPILSNREFAASHSLMTTVRPSREKTARWLCFGYGGTSTIGTSASRQVFATPLCDRETALHHWLEFRIRVHLVGQLLVENWLDLLQTCIQIIEMSEGEPGKNRGDLLRLSGRHARKIEDIACLEVAAAIDDLLCNDLPGPLDEHLSPDAFDFFHGAVQDDRSRRDDIDLLHAGDEFHGRRLLAVVGKEIGRRSATRDGEFHPDFATPIARNVRCSRIGESLMVERLCRKRRQPSPRRAPLASPAASNPQPLTRPALSLS